MALTGDGATSEGDFHEALNFAAVLRAPVVCQRLDQNMGLHDVAVSHTLRETSPGYFDIAESGC